MHQRTEENARIWIWWKDDDCKLILAGRETSLFDNASVADTRISHLHHMILSYHFTSLYLFDYYKQWHGDIEIISLFHSYKSSFPHRESHFKKTYPKVLLSASNDAETLKSSLPWSVTTMTSFWLTWRWNQSIPDFRCDEPLRDEKTSSHPLIDKWQ